MKNMHSKIIMKYEGCYYLLQKVDILSLSSMVIRLCIYIYIHIYIYLYMATASLERQCLSNQLLLAQIMTTLGIPMPSLVSSELMFSLPKQAQTQKNVTI